MAIAETPAAAIAELSDFSSLVHHHGYPTNMCWTAILLPMQVKSSKELVAMSGMTALHRLTARLVTSHACLVLLGAADTTLGLGTILLRGGFPRHAFHASKGERPGMT